MPHLSGMFILMGSHDFHVTTPSKMASALDRLGEDVRRDFSTLPDIIVRNIISWLNYDEISTLRLVRVNFKDRNVV